MREEVTPSNVNLNKTEPTDFEVRERLNPVLSKLGLASLCLRNHSWENIEINMKKLALVFCSDEFRKPSILDYGFFNVGS